MSPGQVGTAALNESRRQVLFVNTPGAHEATFLLVLLSVRVRGRLDTVGRLGTDGGRQTVGCQEGQARERAA